MAAKAVNHPQHQTSSGQGDSLLQTLMNRARHETDIAEFAAVLRQIVEALTGGGRVTVWRGRRIEDLELIGTRDGRPADAAPTAGLAEPGPSDQALALALAERTVQVSASTTGGSADLRTSFDLWILAPIAGGDVVHGLIAAVLPGHKDSEELSHACGLMQSIADAALPFFEGQLTRELFDAQGFYHRYQEFCVELHTEPSWTTTPATIAHEYQRLFHTDRTWLLTPSGRKWRVTAVSGVPGFQRRAEVVQRLELVVSQLARTGEALTWQAGVETPMSPRLRRALDRYLDEAHVCSLRVEPLSPPVPGGESEAAVTKSPAIGMVVCEWFQPPQRPSLEEHWTAARRQASLSLQDAFDWSRTPISRWLRARRRSRSWFAAARRWAIFTAVVAGLTALAALPVEYTIDAVGEIQPVGQRHVFATSDGIVKSVEVSTGDHVSAGETLLLLESPELELEARRVSGELQTAEKRIAALEASRLDYRLEAADSVSQLNLLAGDLSDQLQRRDNLRRELELLEVRRSELKMVSPISGQVVTWDLERLLHHRPVSRGQRLLTIADTSGLWQLELRVSDDDATDLSTTFKQQVAVPLDFIVVTLPGQVRMTKVRSLSETVEVRSQGDAPSLLCLADVPTEAAESAVPGLGVRGRIHCGRRPAIVFGFRKLWRAVQEYLLFPWGW